MSAKLFVPAGASLHLSAGDRSGPSDVFRAGMAPPAPLREIA